MLATKVYGDMGRLAQRGQALRAEHPPGRGRQPEAAADRLHRPLPVPPHRPRNPVGGDLAGHRRPGRRRARSSTPAAATSPAGTSPRPRRPPPAPPIGLVSEQSLYNLLARAELEVIPAAEHYGLGVIPWSPLHGGLLGGVIKQGEGPASAGRGPRRGRLAEHRDAVQAYEDLRDELGGSPATLALAWLLTRPAVTAPIIGPRTSSSTAPWLP